MTNKLRYLADAMPVGDGAIGKMLASLTEEGEAVSFSDLVSRADVAYGRIVFHLKCGLTLEEPLIPPA